MRSGSYEPVGSKASLFLLICTGVLIKKIAMNLPALIQSQWSNFLNHTIRILLVRLMASSPCSIYVPSLCVEAECLISSFLCHVVLKRRGRSIHMDCLVEVMFVILFIDFRLLGWSDRPTDRPTECLTDGRTLRQAIERRTKTGLIG